jgi:uncharacterized membrane protein
MTIPPQRAERQSLSVLVLLATLIVIGLLLRAWHLGDWNFEATEMFTLRDSLRLRTTNSRPLIYLLNYYLVRPFTPLDELGLRLLPMVFGVLTLPALYFVCRRLIGTRAALFSTMLLTISELHVFYSQFARYWSLVILLCTVYPYAIYVGVRQRDPVALGIGVVTGFLAALAHPVSVLLVGGPVIWFVATFLRPGSLRQMWASRGFRWGALLVTVVLAVIVVRFIPVLQSWIVMHDQNPGSGQFLTRPKSNGLKQLVYLAAFVESITVPVTLAAVGGIYVLWQGRDRFLGTYLMSLALFPIAFLTLVSTRTAVSQFYLVPALPVFFIGAGVFLDRLFEIDWKVRPRWVLPAILTVMIVTAGAHTLISYHRNGRRFDFRSAARWIDPRLGTGDAVFSDQPMVLAHYLPQTPVQKLRSLEPLAQSLDSLYRAPEQAALWIVAPAPAHAFRPDLKQGGLARWMWENCQLRQTVGVGRIDFRQQYLQVYRCPAQPPEKERGAG